MSMFQASDADPAVFQLGVRQWADGDEVVLWQPITGRHVRLHRSTLDHLVRHPADPRLGPVRDRLDRFYLLRSSPPPPWPELIPCRSRLVLTLPDEALLWLPVPGFRGPGGHGYRAFRLSPDAHRVWSAINDARPLTEVARRAGVPLVQAQALCTLLTSAEVQALQLRQAPPRPRDAGLERLVDVPRPPNTRPPHLNGPAGETTLTWYHLHHIEDGDTHFDDRETTVAHGLGVPHPALQGRRYGEALRQALRARGLVPDDGVVVEIGCGTGELAAAWQHAGGSSDPTYVRVDLSPELLRTQARRVPHGHGVLADGTRLPLRNESVDLIVNNEVIADLQAVLLDPDQPDSEGAREALALLHKAGVQPHAGRCWVNLGAFHLVREISRVLRPGGAAWLSEFGVRDTPPAEAVQLDHPEVAIEVDQLAAVARAYGLSVTVEPLADVLGLDVATCQISRHSWRAVRALARARELHLPARSWSVHQLRERLPFRVEGLRSVPFTDEGPAPLITRFWSWTLRKPRIPAHSGSG